jgi:hypothetical protein
MTGNENMGIRVLHAFTVNLLAVTCRCSILVAGCSMFVDAVEGVAQVIAYRLFRIQHPSFDGDQFT